MAAPKVQWLYTSQGKAIAFVFERTVYTPTGKFLGVLDGNSVVDGEYVGEIYADSRLVRRRFRPLIIKKGIEPKDAGFTPDFPEDKTTFLLPSDFLDIGPF